MYRTFNCGMGMVICVAQDQAEQAMETLRASGEAPWIVGRIELAEGDEPRVELGGL